MICGHIFNVFISQGCNRVVKTDRQYIQKVGGKQSQKAGAPLTKDYTKQCQVATRGEDGGQQERVVNSQVIILD